MSVEFRNSLPEELVSHVSAICGTRGEEWFDGLPKLIAELERRWSVTVLAPYPGIEFNFVAPAISSVADIRMVIKIAPPFERTEIFGEAKYLATRNGEGSVRLLAEDRESHAILIEHSLPGTSLFRYFEDDPAACIEPAIEVLRSILRPPPADMTDVGTLDNWFEKFSRYVNTDFPKKNAAKALEIYERLAEQPGRTFYLHGDFHPGNIVSGTRAPFLAIDPKGIVGHLGYDVAVFLNNLHWWQKGDPNVDVLLDEAVTTFAKELDFREEELREWAFSSMVIGAWWNFDDMPNLYDGDVAITEVWRV